MVRFAAIYNRLYISTAPITTGSYFFSWWKGVATPLSSKCVCSRQVPASWIGDPWHALRLWDRGESRVGGAHPSYTRSISRFRPERKGRLRTTDWRSIFRSALNFSTNRWRISPSRRRPRRQRLLKSKNFSIIKVRDRRIQLTQQNL